MMKLILCLIAVASITAQLPPKALFTGYYGNMTLLNCSNSSYANQDTQDFFTLGLYDSDESINSDSSDDVISVSYGTQAEVTIDRNFSRTSHNPLTWVDFDENSTLLTYSTDPSTNQTTLFAQYNFEYDTYYCWYSYQKNLSLISGTWQLNSQSTGDSGELTTLTINSVDDTYMTITANFANGTSKTGYFYRKVFDGTDDIIYEGLGHWIYTPGSDVFEEYITQQLYSKTSKGDSNSLRPWTFSIILILLLVNLI